MKLTDKHISDPQLNALIVKYSFASGIRPNRREWRINAERLASALLELKQRRAEDRQREQNINPNG